MLMVREMSDESDEKKLVVCSVLVVFCEIIWCFLTLDFVTVKYFPVVYVASRHFIILYIFVRQIIVPVLIKGNNLKRCTYILIE